MHTLLLGTSGGNVYVYDLPKALENERILRRSKLSLGVEEDLVYSYLIYCSQLDVIEYI